MAGIKVFGNETADNSGLAPGQLPGELFSAYLARIHATWTKSKKSTSKSFAAVTLNPAHTAHPDISENYIDWLNRFVGEIEGKGKNKAVIANLDLEGTSPIRVQPGQITNHTEEKITPETALAMATLAMADPKMRKKGVTLEGSDEEKMLLLHALKQIGFAGKIHNAPDRNNPEYDKAALAILGSLPGFVTHVGAKAQPNNPPGPPPVPPAAPPRPPQ